jgi:hypothetical protein
MNQETKQASNGQGHTPLRSGALLGHNDEPLQAALTLVSVSPVKTRMWMQAAIDMAEYCQGTENCDQAAMRVLANEVYRLRQAISETLKENAHLADGDVCTLIKLKRAMWPNAKLSDREL